MTYMREKSKKEWMYVYVGFPRGPDSKESLSLFICLCIELIHFAVQ